jgi:diguanylate cyclase (GGDEF)-like protein
MDTPQAEERLRLEALTNLDLLDKPAEERFQRIARLVRSHFRASASAITLLDADRAYYLAHDGLKNRQTPRSSTLCSHVVEGKTPVVVADHSADSLTELYKNLIEKLNLSFYAGVPIITPEGYAVGALCVMDHIPRKFTRRELELLADFAAIVEDEILIRRATQTNRELISQVEKLRMRAFVDPLTGVWNRSGIFDVLRRESERTRRSGQPLTVCMLDLDHFKRINDTYHHQAGDEVLKETCVRVTEAVRSYDALGRYGGEEFLLIFPETDLAQAEQQAQRVRKAVGGEPFQVKPEVEETVTISVGVAQLGSEESLEQAIARADDALYQAKESGRNKVVCAANA